MSNTRHTAASGRTEADRQLRSFLRTTAGYFLSRREIAQLCARGELCDIGLTADDCGRLITA